MAKYTENIQIIRELEEELDDCKSENNEMADALNEIANIVGHSQEGANPVLGRVSKMVMRHDVMEVALIRLRDCDWVRGIGDRMDAVRDIAREALLEVDGEKS